MRTQHFLKYVICSIALLTTTCNAVPTGNLEEQVSTMNLDMERIEHLKAEFKEITQRAEKSNKILSLIATPLFGSVALLYSYASLKTKNRDSFDNFIVATTGSIGIGSFVYWLHQIAQELELIQPSLADTQPASNENDHSSKQPSIYSLTLTPILGTIALYYGYRGLSIDNRNGIDKFIAAATTSIGVGSFALWLRLLAQKQELIKPLTSARSSAALPTLGTMAVIYSYFALKLTQKDDDSALKYFIAGTTGTIGVGSYAFWLYLMAQDLELIEPSEEPCDVNSWNLMVLELLSTIIGHI